MVLDNYYKQLPVPFNKLSKSSNSSLAKISAPGRYFGTKAGSDEPAAGDSVFFFGKKEGV